jgi:hypothetical protein
MINNATYSIAIITSFYIPQNAANSDMPRGCLPNQFTDQVQTKNNRCNQAHLTTSSISNGTKTNPSYSKLFFDKICVKFTLWTHCRARGNRLEFKRRRQTEYLVHSTLNSMPETNELFYRTPQFRRIWYVISWSRNIMFYATQSSLALPQKRITGKLFSSSFTTTNNITKICKVMSKIWGFHSGDYEECRLLGCGAM